MSELNKELTPVSTNESNEVGECDGKEKLKFLGYDDEGFACFSGVTF